MKRCTSKKYIILSVIILFVLLLFAGNLFMGSVDIPFDAVIKILSGKTVNEGWEIIVMEHRLPQAVVALLAGMAISVAGLILQTLFNNPLAGPEVLGINSGAGLGVAIVMLLMSGSYNAGEIAFSGYVAILFGAFAGAIIVILIILALASSVRNNIFLLIAGLAVSYLASSVVSLLNFFSTAEGVQSFLIWGMGNFGSVSNDRLPLFAGLLVPALLLSLMMIKPLNALLLGNAYAANLGVRTKRSRIILLALSGLMASVVTAFCGPIAFIGLAIPHLARLALGTNNHKMLMPAVILLGGMATLLCNILCQIPGEMGLIPLGAITPMIGAPVILYVVMKGKFK